MRILIATDAWRPQINGVVHSLEQMSAAARTQGAQIDFLTPQGFRAIPLPTYPDIKLALAPWGAVGRRIAALGADHIHIATEGPIGLAARRYCQANGRVFTTSYHTRFPEYVSARTRIPERWTYAALRWFHAPAAVVMVPTPTMRDELSRRGFARVKVWSRGVDHLTFRPRTSSVLDLPRPIFLYVGRLAVEKNLGALLSLKLPGSTVIVGDGPARASLERQYPHAHFLGPDVAMFFCLAQLRIAEAINIAEEDVATNKMIGRSGARTPKKEIRYSHTVARRVSCVDSSTPLGVFISAIAEGEKNKSPMSYRPFDVGSRITTSEVV